MQQVSLYHIEVQGPVDERELNAGSPRELAVVRAGPAATGLAVRTDQSGLIGLLRHLHGRGFVLLSITRED